MKIEAETIRKKVSMIDMIRRYGFKENRAGFIKCPFHREKTASLKIYQNDRGWCCFGCGKYGSVIDFVELLFGLDYSEAVKKIDVDFSVGIYKKPTLTQYRKQQSYLNASIQRQKKQAEAENKYWEVFDEWKRLSSNMVNFVPISDKEDYHPLFIEACQKISYTEYLLEYYDEQR